MLEWTYVVVGAGALVRVSLVAGHLGCLGLGRVTVDGKCEGLFQVYAKVWIS